MGVLRKRFAALTIFVCAVFSIGQLAAQSAASLTLVKAGRLLDPRTGSVLAPAAVLIEDAKIKEVGLPTELQKKMPGSARTIDLGNATLLPGLIDSHTHLQMDDIVLPAEAERRRRYNGDYVPAQILAIVESPSKRVLVGAQMAGKIWRVVSPRCAILDTPELTAMSA